MTLTQTIHTEELEFDTYFSRYSGSFGNKPKKEVKTFLKASHQRILQAVVVEIEKHKRVEIHDLDIRHNATLDALKTTLIEAINK